MDAMIDHSCRNGNCAQTDLEPDLLMEGRGRLRPVWSCPECGWWYTEQGIASRES